LQQALPAQPLYFPPLTGSTWETRTPASLGWCEDRLPPLRDYLDQQNTKAFIVLKDGKIAIEWYFDAFTRDSLWYWASAGKTVTAALTGIALREGHLSLSDPTFKYLGAGWTICSPDEEVLITIRHQLTMTSGLDDRTGDPYCTKPACLRCIAAAGNRWAYHNAPYTLLDSVLQTATGMSLNAWYIQKLRNRIGMNGLFLRSGDNNVLYTTPRSMARFGLLMLNKGIWNTTPILDTAFFRQMVTTSQALNLSYGYLWWLNGKSSFMVPQSQVVFPGSFSQEAPKDMFAALGKNGQVINVIPGQGLVLIRMGNAPDASLVPFMINNEIWRRLNAVMCTTSVTSASDHLEAIRIQPNPATDQIRVEAPEDAVLTLLDALGTPLSVSFQAGTTDVRGLSSGIYLLRVRTTAGVIIKKLMIQR
jgi:CubicO group peptidase (beta-lactamase class C family)